MRELWVGYCVGVGVMGSVVCMADLVGLSVPVAAIAVVCLTPLGIWIANRTG